MTITCPLISGFVSSPIPYLSQTNDCLTFTLLLCLVFSAIILANGKKTLSQKAKGFFSNRERASIFDTAATPNSWVWLGLYIQTCLLAAIIYYKFFENIQTFSNPIATTVKILIVYTCCGLFYLWLKRMIYTFIGWVFFDKAKTGIWLESYSALIYYIGFFLFPLVFITIYCDLNLTCLLLICLIFLIFAKLLILYKWIRIFLSKISLFSLLFLYFCAIEIIPFIMMYKGMAQINRMLIVKF